MQWLTRSDTILLCIAAYIAVTALVRMMKRRRDQVVADVQRQVEAYRKRPKHGGSGEGKKAA
jgi:uncharacterized membrane protein